MYLRKAVELVDFAFERACVILPAFEATAQAGLEDWVFEIELQLRAMRDDLSLILQARSPADRSGVKIRS